MKNRKAIAFTTGVLAAIITASAQGSLIPPSALWQNGSDRSAAGCALQFEGARETFRRRQRLSDENQKRKAHQAILNIAARRVESALGADVRKEINFFLNSLRNHDRIVRKGEKHPDYYATVWFARKEGQALGLAMRDAHLPGSNSWGWSDWYFEILENNVTGEPVIIERTKEACRGKGCIEVSYRPTMGMAYPKEVKLGIILKKQSVDPFAFDEWIKTSARYVLNDRNQAVLDAKVEGYQSLAFEQSKLLNLEFRYLRRYANKGCRGYLARPPKNLDPHTATEDVAVFTLGQ